MTSIFWEDMSGAVAISVSPDPSVTEAALVAAVVPPGQPWRAYDATAIPAGVPAAAWVYTASGPLGVNTAAPVIWAGVRAWRARILLATDKIRQQIARQAVGAAPAHPIDDATAAAAWQVWTQALADIPETFGSPADVIWPAPPATPSVTWPAFPPGIGTLAPGWPLI